MGVSKLGSGLRALALATIAGTTTVAAHAADAWPGKPITLIVPFPPGGNTDTLGRIVAERLGAVLKQPVVVLNKPGAGSMLGTTIASHAAPDGQTFLIGSIANVINPFIYREPTVDVEKEMVPVSQLVNVPNYLAVAPESTLHSVGDVIAYAKANPGKLSCATTGVGTSPYISCELLKSLAHVDITNVPYKGGAAAMTDAMGGQASMVFANEALPLIASKHLVGLGVTTGRRSPLSPELPAISESVPGYDVTAWYGVFAPAGTPPAIVERIAHEVAAAMADESVRSRLKAIGAVPVGSTPKEFATLVHTELKKWGDVIRPMNIRLD